MSDLGMLAPLSAAFRQLMDEIGFLCIFKTSSFDLDLSYVAYFWSDKMDWSVFDLHDLFKLYHFAAGCVHPLPQEVVPGSKQAPWHLLSDLLPCLVPARYHEEPSLTLNQAVRFVRNLLGRTCSGVSAGQPTSFLGPAVDDVRLKIVTYEISLFLGRLICPLC